MGRRRIDDRGGLPHRMGTGDVPQPTAIGRPADRAASSTPGGHEVGMLDDRSAHVDDIDTFVGAMGEIHRAEPDVGRSQEFLSSSERSAGESGTIGLQSFAMHEVPGRVAGEGRPLVIGGERTTPIDRHAAGSGELVGTVRGMSSTPDSEETA